MSARRVRHRTGAGSAVNPDHVGWHYAIVFGVLVTLGAAIAVSWAGLTWVGTKQGLGPLRWLTPVMIDVPLVVLTLARGALRKRGIDKPAIFRGILALTIYSSAVNVLHSLSVADWSRVDVSSTDALIASVPALIEIVVGAVTNGLAPWLILGLTEVLWVVVTKPIKPRSKPRRGTKPAAVVARSSRPVEVAAVAIDAEAAA